MKKIKISICTGTACFVMGASELMLLEDHLPEELKPFVEIQGLTCMEKCKDAKNGKAPFVEINGELISSANLSVVLDKINEIEYSSNAEK